MNLSVGYLLADAQIIQYDYPCGGAGMLMSREAYEIVAPGLTMESLCPFVTFNDMTLGVCLSRILLFAMQ
jgi:hypothetical protein